MELAASIGPATMVLGLSLTIQSQILMMSPDKWNLLAKKLRMFAYWLAAPSGIILVIIGLILPILANHYISLGVTLIIVAITSIIQSQVLISSKESYEKLGQKMSKWANICLVAGIIAIVIYLLIPIFAIF